MASDPEALVACLTGSGWAFGCIGLEACPLSHWIHDGLSAAGLPAICLGVRRLKASLAGAVNKTDRNDARGIAQVVRLGWFRRVHVKSDASHRIRMVLASRKMLQKQVQDLENHIRGSLKTFGLKIGRVTKRRFEARVLELVGSDAGLEAGIEPLLRARSRLLAEFRALDEQVKEAACLDTVCIRFMTVPGVGPITALTFLSAVDESGVFARRRPSAPTSG